MPQTCGSQLSISRFIPPAGLTSSFFSLDLCHALCLSVLPPHCYSSCQRVAQHVDAHLRSCVPSQFHGTYLLSEPIKKGEDGLCAPGCLISAGKERFREVFASLRLHGKPAAHVGISPRGNGRTVTGVKVAGCELLERKWESGRKLSREAAIGKEGEKHVIRSENEAAKAEWIVVMEQDVINLKTVVNLATAPLFIYKTQTRRVFQEYNRVWSILCCPSCMHFRAYFRADICNLSPLH